MRIAILTILGYSNFGNRLQNLAIQNVLRSISGVVPDTIANSPRSGQGGSRFQRRLSKLADEGIGALGPWIRMKVHPSPQGVPMRGEHFLGHRRELAIRDFVKDRINQTDIDYSDKSGHYGLALDYDRFVAGSDQIWNPTFGLRDHLRFIEFAEPSKRIAYAASFGVPSIPRYLRQTYAEGIASMAHVAVREYRAAEMVRELTGRAVPVVLDPTMLLQPAEWETLAKVPQSLSGGGYVAEFFLGTATDEEMHPVQQFAADRDLDRVDLRSDKPEDLAGMGPLEFIGAIKASKLLVTDSFHAAVFATIFRVPYLLKGRGAMNSRFDTLLHKSGLPMPRWRTLRELEASIDIDWDAVHQNIARERAQSLDYLRSALSPPDGA